MRSSLLIAGVFMLTACTPPVWTHQSKDASEWDVDSSECQRDARMAFASRQPPPSMYQQPSYAAPGATRSEVGVQMSAMGDEMDWTVKCLGARGWHQS